MSEATSRALEAAIRKAVEESEGLPEGYAITNWFVYGEGIKYENDSYYGATFRFVVNDEMADSTYAGLLHMASMEHDDELRRKIRGEDED